MERGRGPPEADEARFVDQRERGLDLRRGDANQLRLVGPLVAFDDVGDEGGPGLGAGIEELASSVETGSVPLTRVDVSLPQREMGGRGGRVGVFDLAFQELPLVRGEAGERTQTIAADRGPDVLLVCERGRKSPAAVVIL